MLRRAGKCMKTLKLLTSIGITAVMTVMAGCSSTCGARQALSSDSEKRAMLNEPKEQDGVSAGRSHMTRTHGKAELN